MDYNSAYDTASVYTDSMASFNAQVDDAMTGVNGTGFNRSITAAILRAIAPGTHLDVGMGNGFLLEIARRAGHTVFGVDVSEKSRAFVATTIPSATVGAQLSDVPGTFSTVTALEVLEHVADPLALIRELYGRVTDGGLLVLSVPNVERPYWRSGEKGGERKQWVEGGVGDTSPHHLTRFSADGLRALLRRAGIGDFHVGHTPLDVVTWLVWDLEMPLAMPLLFGLRRRALPMAWIQRFLMDRIVLPFWRRDESSGYGIMVVARKGEAAGRPSLRSLFEQTRENLIQRHLECLERSLVREVPKYATAVLTETATQFVRRHLPRGKGP